MLPTRPVHATRPLSSLVADAGSPPLSPGAAGRAAAGAALRPVLPAHVELLELVDVGGMGAVWRAWDHRRGAEVAIKAPRAGSQALALSLRSEFRRAAGVHHPHVVALYELFAEGPTPAFSMEWLRGGPAEAAPPLPELLLLLRDAAAGLEALHAVGLAHGDLKPRNLFVERTSTGAWRRAVLVDFGLTRRSGAVEGLLAGTPDYMAPELLDGGPPSVEGDLYALGVLIYQALTGRPPAIGPAARQRAIKGGRWFEAPADRAPGCPDALSALAMELLSPAPDDRPPLAAVAAAVARGPGLPPRRWISRPALEGALAEALAAAAPRPLPRAAPPRTPRTPRTPSGWAGQSSAGHTPPADNMGSRAILVTPADLLAPPLEVDAAPDQTGAPATQPLDLAPPAAAAPAVPSTVTLAEPAPAETAAPGATQALAPAPAAALPPAPPPAPRPSTAAFGPRWLQLIGPAGTGKTALLERALRGWAGLQLRAACAPAERVALPGLDGLVDELSLQLRHLRRHGFAPSAHLLAHAAALFPALDRGGPVRATRAEDRAAALDALAGLLNQVAEDHGLLILIEDLQWAGRDVPALLGRLLPQLSPRCLVLLSARDDAALDGLRGPPELGAAHALGPLSLAELRAAIGAAAVDAALGAPDSEINEVELDLPVGALGLLSAATPGGRLPGWSGVLLRRLRLLGEGPRRVVSACAIAAGPLPLRLLHRLALDDASLRAAAHAGLLQIRAGSDGPDVILSPALSPEALQPGPGDRLAERLAAALEAEGPELAGLAAAQLEALGAPARAQAAHLRAARWALAGGAFAAAADAFAAARRLGAAPADCGEEQGRALAGAGQIAAAAATWAEAAAALGGPAGVRLRGEAAGLLVATGEVTAGVALYDQLMQNIGQRAIPGNLGAMWALLFTRELPGPRPGLPAPTEAEQAALEALWSAGLALARHEPLPGLAALARHRTLAARLDAPAHHALALGALRWTHSATRVSPAAVEAAVTALTAALGGEEAAAARLGPRVWGYLQAADALAELLAGRWVLAAAKGAAAERCFGPAQLQSWEGRAVRLNTLSARIWQVDQRGLRAEVDRAIEVSRLAGDATQCLVGELTLGARCTLLTEGPAAAEERLAAAVDAWGRPMSAELSWRHRAIRAELALFNGDIDQLEALLTKVPLAERPILSYALPQVQLRWLRGLGALRRGGSKAERRLREAAAALHRVQNNAGEGFALALQAWAARLRGAEAEAHAQRQAAGLALRRDGHPLIAALVEGGPAAWPCPGLDPLPGVIPFIAGALPAPGR